MIFTLHRYIFRELLRVFVLTVVALTLILSLGSILRPVQEYGVGPRQVLNLMGYFLPITLTFVLPMAALFAGALVYGRLTSDNELDACRASGISLMTMICPGLALAIIVAIANLLLSFHVMPAFVHLAEKSIKANAKQILFRNIQRKRYYTLPDSRYLIYADQANPQKDALSGVVVVEIKDDGIKKIITAESAKVSFKLRDRFNEVQITAYMANQMGAEDEGGAEWLSLTAEFGSLLGDDIKFKKIDEMKRIQADLMQFYPIDKLARDTYAQLVTELLAQDIKTAMDDSNNNFYELLGEPNSVKFTATQCSAQDEEQIDLSGDVVVIETDSKQTVRTLKCARASLHIEGNKLAPTLTMDIYNARVVGSEELRMRDIVRGLIPPMAVEAKANKFKTEKNGSLSLRVEKLASELTGLQPSPQLTTLQKALKRKIDKTRAQIKAEIHSRLVFGIGCVSMILIGIGLGIIKRGGHLLSAFGASCVPAAVLIVCIMSGKHITENLGSQNISGIALMWAGLAFLSLLAVVIYGWLLKH